MWNKAYESSPDHQLLTIVVRTFLLEEGDIDLKVNYDVFTVNNK